MNERKNEIQSQGESNFVISTGPCEENVRGHTGLETNPAICKTLKSDQSFRNKYTLIDNIIRDEFYTQHSSREKIQHEPSLPVSSQQCFNITACVSPRRNPVSQETENLK